MIKNISRQQSGSILLYSLLVISLITAIAIIISVIVVNEIKLTSAASNGVQAYYAAESGIEKGLYAVKIYRSDQEVDLEQAADEISQFFENNFENKASFENIKTDFITAKVENVFVAENDYIQIDYYDVNNPLNPDPNKKVVGIRIRNDGDDPVTWAEVSWTAWDNQGILGTSTEAKKIIGPSDLSGTNGWPINDLDVFDSDNNTGFDGDPVGYRVRIKALKAIPSDVGDGNLSSLTVIPYDDTPPPLGGGDVVTDLPTQLVIKSVGNRNNFKQSLVATVPWNLPLLGLYDYVLFSESEILKDIILNPSTFVSGTQDIEEGLTGSQTNDQCDGIDCSSCQGKDWSGLSCGVYGTIACFSDSYTTSDPDKAGTCRLGTEDQLWGLTMPISDIVNEGEYYLSIRMSYSCKDGDADGNCDISHTGNGRAIYTEINGQQVIIPDQTFDKNNEWMSCTIPDVFLVGDANLPENDESRVVDFGIYPQAPKSSPTTYWKDNDWVSLDWYQLSTYKIFPDCY